MNRVRCRSAFLHAAESENHPVGERESLADFREMEPEPAAQAIYSEYEDTLQFADADTLKARCQWVWQNAQQLELPGPAADARLC